jgi:hypothetical protein
MLDICGVLVGIDRFIERSHNHGSMVHALPLADCSYNHLIFV